MNLSPAAAAAAEAAKSILSEPGSAGAEYAQGEVGRADADADADADAGPGANDVGLPALLLTKMPAPVRARVETLTQSQRHLMALAGLSLLCLPIFWSILFRALGTAIGVGLGLGLAAHVHDVLDRWKDGADDDKYGSRGKQGQRGGGFDASPKSSPIQQPRPSPGLLPALARGGTAEHGENSYHVLMAGAGFDVPQGLLRGQILRRSVPPASGSTAGGLPLTAASVLENLVASGPNQGQVPNPLYPHSVPGAFSAFSPPPVPRGAATVQGLYPNLPAGLCAELGAFVDLVARDFVHSWYCIIDHGAILFELEGDRRNRVAKEAEEQRARAEEKEKEARERRLEEERKRRAMEVVEEGRRAIEGSNGSGGSKSADGAAAASIPFYLTPSIASDPPTTAPQPLPPNSKRSLMVMSTSPLRPSPFPEALYVLLASVLGSFAVSARDNVNIMELVLVKLVRVLSLNIKVYRELRRVAVVKRRRRLAVARGKAARERERSRSSSLTGSHSEILERKEEAGESLSGGSRRVEESGRSSTAEAAYVAETGEDLALPSLLKGAGIASADPEGSNPSSVAVTSDPSKANGPQSHQPLPSESEIAVIREYLLAGKLHRAITFGMDVPSLLFADPNGKDCPPPPASLNEDEKEVFEATRGTAIGATRSDIARPARDYLEDDAVLEARLFSPKSRLLAESELDYCRILSYRLVKLTTSKADFSSTILRSMATDIFATCVLAPVMGCFSPEMINYGMKKVLEPLTREPEQGTHNAASSSGPGSSFSEECADEMYGEDGEEKMTTEWERSRSRSAIEENASAKSKDKFGSKVEDEGIEMENRIVNSADSILGGEIDGNDNDVDELSLVGESEAELGNSLDGARNVLPLLTMTIIDLQRHLDFEDVRRARERGREIEVNWDDASCKAAVRRVVLVIEAALLHGLRSHRKKKRPNQNGGSFDEPEKDPFGSTLASRENSVGLEEDGRRNDEKAEDESHIQASTLSAVLMEMTSDLDSFEKHIAEKKDRKSQILEDREEDETTLESLPPIPPSEISTIRTLIAAWLHTGQLYRTLSVFLRSKETILLPFYHPLAFFCNEDGASDFVRQLRVLDGVDVLVDTAAILRSRGLDLGRDLHVDNFNGLLDEEVDKQNEKGEEGLTEGFSFGHTFDGQSDDIIRSLQQSANRFQSIGDSLVGGVKANLRSNSQRLSRFVAGDASVVNSSSASPLVAAAAVAHRHLQSNSATPPHLVFSRNNAFASSLRVERERRMHSWGKVTEAVSVANRSKARSGIDMICHTRGLTEEDIVVHRELHQLARILYSGTFVMTIQSNTAIDVSNLEGSMPLDNTVITMENITSRRRFEVPDDDSSFLLRAQSRPLNPVGVHRDQRNHEQSFKSFAATYEEPIYHQKSKRYRGGRYIRRCLVSYFPSNRTASAIPLVDGRQLDQRQSHCGGAGSNDIKRIDNRRNTTSAGSGESKAGSAYLPAEFQKQRHLCNKHMQAGSANVLTSSILASTVMESSDFSSSPRSGKALDFVYRNSLFEKPVIDLAGKQFTIQDSTIMGPHRADASALEMSDAALSYALLTLVPHCEGGMYLKESHSNDDESGSNKEQLTGAVTLHKDEDGFTVVLMKINTSRKQDAADKDQAGVTLRSVRPSFLRAAMLVTSTKQEAQLQCLLSCVRSGSARNATKAQTDLLLQPSLTLLEFAVSKKREKQSILLRDLKLGMNHIDGDQLRRNGILYPRYPTVLRTLSASIEGALKAKTSTDILGAPAIVLYKIRCCAIVEFMAFGDNDEENGKVRNFFREEWVVLRPFRDFMVLHKYLKNQVSLNESSGNTGAKLVGAAAAALTFGESSQRQRRALIPSLGQATKAGALGVTQRSVERRRDILNEYLSYLTNPHHLLNKCPELLRFLGACDPLPMDLSQDSRPDHLGRIDTKRIPLSQNVVAEQLGVDEMIRDNTTTPSSKIQSSSRIEAGGSDDDLGNFDQTTPTASSAALAVGATKVDGGSEPSNALDNMVTPKKQQVSDSTPSMKKRKGTSTVQRARFASIKSQVEAVKLSEVRNGIFQFIRYQFDLDNASFFRSRIVSALKTMSFAVTSAHEFHKMLFHMHLQHSSSEALVVWIRLAREIIWPDGVFFTPRPELTDKEKKIQEEEAKEMLIKVFPEQMRSLLGQEIANDGLAVFHEMLQNRVVLRSIAYMLMDEVWVSVFPELRDFVTCARVLESEV